MTRNEGGVEIRAFAYPEDYAAVYDLWSRSGPGVQVGRSDTPDEIIKKLQHDPDLFLVAEVDGHLVGTVIGGFDGRRGMVYHLAVSPGLRQLGVGTALMAELEQRLIQKGCLKSYLMVTRDNPDAMRFYTGIGWERMDVEVALFCKELE